MKEKSKKISAFTFAEALLVLIIIGIIAAITIPQLLVDDPAKKGWTTLAEKTVGNLIQASTEILIYDAGLDDFTSLTYNGKRFSIEDADITSDMSGLYGKYIANTTQDVDLANEYFSKPLATYDKNALDKTLKELYSDFFIGNDGVLIGFRFYGGCDKTEENVVLPAKRNRYSVNNICGSVYIDVNSYKKPNKLGSDQYIVPIAKRGIVYEDN